jgi:hypothetical protein
MVHPTLTLADLVAQLDAMPKFPRMAKYYQCNRKTYDALAASVRFSPTPDEKLFAAPMHGVQVWVNEFILEDGFYDDEMRKVVAK